VNGWLFRAAGKLHRLNIEPEKIEAMLREATHNSGGGDVKADAISAAVRNSAPSALQSHASYHHWANPNYRQMEWIAVRGLRLSQVVSESPVAPSEANRAEEIIDALFPGEALLCAGASISRVRTALREEWRGHIAQQQFIVPSPMSQPTGVTAQGKTSARSFDNTGPRRFLVVEFDFTELAKLPSAAAMLGRLRDAGITITDLCAALHAHLADFRPLALILQSGEDSLHGWYPCRGDDTILKFMRYATSLGANPATWTPCELVRIPDGTHDNGTRQRVLYFNPAVIGGSK
jgi:hypothetical protein